MNEFITITTARQPVGAVVDYNTLTRNRVAMQHRRHIGRGVALELLLLVAYLAAVVGAVALVEWIG